MARLTRYLNNVLSIVLLGILLAGCDEKPVVCRLEPIEPTGAEINQYLNLIMSNPEALGDKIIKAEMICAVNGAQQREVQVMLGVVGLENPG